jgi:YegS/Rv2252/BmrU family lipid kinase
MVTHRVKIRIIANPVSGTGGTSAKLVALERLLIRAGCRISVHPTTCPGDASRLAKALGSDADLVVVAGGDGTVSEVVNGLDTDDGPPIAIMATGGANVLARELGLPRDAEGVAAMILAGRTRTIDVGVVDQGRKFLAVLSVGFDASVVKAVQRTRTGTLGMRGFVLPTIRTAIGYAPPAVTVTVDDGEPVDGALVIVANTGIYGGIMRVSDRARCDSGRLEVVVFPQGSASALLRYGWAAIRGRVSHLPGVICRTGRAISIASRVDADCQADGEYLGSTPVTVHVRPKGATIVVPPRP